MSDPPVEGTFRYEDADYVEFTRRHARWGVLLVGAVTAVVVGTLAYATFRDARVLDRMLRDPAFLAFLGVAAAALAWFLWLGPRRVGRGVRAKFGRDEVTVRFDEVGVHLESSRFTARHGWEEFDRVAETPRLLVLYLTRDLAYVIPKRAFDERAAKARERAVARVGADR